MRYSYLFFLLLFFCSCIEEDQPAPDQLQALTTIVPEGWLVGLNVEHHASKTFVEGLDRPDVVAVFVNPELKFVNLDDSVVQSPSLILNFYDKSRRQEIEDQLESYISYSPCKATLYDSTSQFLVFSSYCLENHGFNSNVSEQMIKPLHNSLHSYFDEVK